MVTFLKTIIFLSALISTGFGVALIFFYEQFKIFNELVNNRFLVGKNKYGNGSEFFIDRFVFGWHTFLGILCLLIGIWLFYTFFLYLSL